MEVFFGIALLVLGGVFAVLMLRAGLWLLFAILLPLAWLWLLVDAILRRDAEYPSGDTAEKVVWIVLMLFVQPAAIAYYLLVYRKIRRGESIATTAAG